MDTAGNCYAQDDMKTVPAVSQCRQSTRHIEGLNMYLLYSNPIFYPELVVCEYNWILCYTFDIKGQQGTLLLWITYLVVADLRVPIILQLGFSTHSFWMINGIYFQTFITLCWYTQKQTLHMKTALIQVTLKQH